MMIHKPNAFCGCLQWGNEGLQDISIICGSENLTAKDDPCTEAVLQELMEVAITVSNCQTKLGMPLIHAACTVQCCLVSMPMQAVCLLTQHAVAAAAGP